ncbi:MAG: transposase, partial [Sphingobacteriales bacterium]
MQNILRDLKSFTSRQMRQAIQEHPQESRREWMLWMMERAGSKNSNNQKSGFQFWQQHNQPIELFSNHVLQQKLDYVHRNPVEAGFVSAPEDFVYSSARDYAGEKGLLDIILIE